MAFTPREALDMRCVLGILALLLTCALVAGVLLVIHNARANRTFEALVHGQARLSRMEIDGYDHGLPIHVAFTNRADLDYISAACAKSTINDRGAFRFFRGTIWLTNQGAAKIDICIADSRCLVISHEAIPSIFDPVEYRVLLDSPAPTNVLAVLEYLLALK
jgi:hypothetical protein